MIQILREHPEIRAKLASVLLYLYAGFAWLYLAVLYVRGAEVRDLVVLAASAIGAGQWAAQYESKG